MVQHLIAILPEPYYAAPGIRLGSLYEVDVGTYDDPSASSAGLAAGGVTVAAYVPPKPTLTLEPDLSGQDVYEVQIFDSRRNRRLVAAVELVSPSNKDRPDNRDAFVSKVSNLLKNNICVSIVDVVTTMNFNLYAALLAAVRGTDPALGQTAPPTYVATARTRYEKTRKLMDNWYYPLAVGRPLPTLPIWLREGLAVSLDLERTYEDTCRGLRIA